MGERSHMLIDIATVVSELYPAEHCVIQSRTTLRRWGQSGVSLFTYCATVRRQADASRPQPQSSPPAHQQTRW